jgi:hypothetical protein
VVVAKPNGLTVRVALPPASYTVVAALLNVNHRHRIISSKEEYLLVKEQQDTT